VLNSGRIAGAVQFVKKSKSRIHGATMPRFRILVVDDFEPFRQFIRFTLKRRAEFQIIGEASDGLEAVRKAEELQPDLILLDIGLPKLNGIETARQIRKLIPESKILFLSQASDADVVQTALGPGISGYVVKINAGRELLTAVEAVLQGEQFVSSRLAAHLREGVRSNSHFRFEFDPENKILQGKFQGPVTPELIKDYYRDAASAVAATDFRGSITNFSDAAGCDVTPRAIRDLAALPFIDPVELRPDVIVAPSDVMFGLSRLFQTIREADNLHVVRNLQQAFALLGVISPSFGPI
jgi:DNA-binding NarL/FixJ family response regulator